MKPEELLKPRYKVIADYPANPEPMGKIIALNKVGQYNIHGNWVLPEMYPAIFRKLQWWEEREEKDLPEYLKHSTGGVIVRVIKWNFHFVTVKIHNDFFDRDDIVLVKNYLPATESDHLKSKEGEEKK